jgi:shikimate kinase
MNIFLIGYRCAGKTTIGRCLAKRLERLFFDTDFMDIDAVCDTIIQKIKGTEHKNNFGLIK